MKPDHRMRKIDRDNFTPSRSASIDASTKIEQVEQKYNHSKLKYCISSDKSNFSCLQISTNVVQSDKSFKTIPNHDQLHWSNC